MDAIEISEPFTSRDLARLGLTRRRLRTLLAHGDMRRVVRGVYAPTALGDGLDIRLQALALVVSVGHVVCDRTAAWVHGIDLYTYGEHDLGLPVETCVASGCRPTSLGGTDGQERDLAPGEVMDIRGITVTTPVRTALDLASILERRDALAALDAFRRRHNISTRELRTVLDRRFRRRRGVVQARELVAHADPRAESTRESWVRLAIIDAGLPLPDLQVWVKDNGVELFRLDLAYRRRRIAIEYDGFDAHESDEEKIRATEDRRAWLRAHGWTVIVVRNGDFTGANLERWLDDLREALRASYTNRRRLERGPGSARRTSNRRFRPAER